MSAKYDEYLRNHNDAVIRAFYWFRHNIPEMFEYVNSTDTQNRILDFHDKSSYDREEYNWRDAFMIFGENKLNESLLYEYKKACLRHIHLNPHHWEHWVAFQDALRYQALRIPETFAIEMLCDWWAPSWMSNDLTWIFRWYNKNYRNIILHIDTRTFVEDNLKRMKNILEVKSSEP